MIRNRDVVIVKDRRHTVEAREKPDSVKVVQGTILGGAYSVDFPTNEEVIAYVFGGA